ncbi:hypothetical protein LCGC14_2591320, partial [marine sediment metagenome]
NRLMSSALSSWGASNEASFAFGAIELVGYGGNGG